MRCLRLPFGYVDSPRTTEEEAYGPVAVELLRDDRPKSKAADGCIGVLVDSKGSYHKSGGPHQPLGTEFFVVTHLIERIEVPSSPRRGTGIGRRTTSISTWRARRERSAATLRGSRTGFTPCTDAAGPLPRLGLVGADLGDRADAVGHRDDR